MKLHEFEIVAIVGVLAEWFGDKVPVQERTALAYRVIGAIEEARAEHDSEVSRARARARDKALFHHRD